MKIHNFNPSFRRLLLLALITISLSGCYPVLMMEAKRPAQALKRVRFFYPVFRDDMDLSTLSLALERNLIYLDRLNPEHIFYYGTDKYTSSQVRDSQMTLLDLISQNPGPAELNRFIRKHFLVYRATGRMGNRNVLFTGYFEPIYRGSLKPDDKFRYPLYEKPDDLMKINLSLFRKEFKGKSITARIEGNRVVPYHSRKQIESEKALEGRNLEIAWLEDPVDVAFLHIQGSGRLLLPDGSTLSVGYHSSNGRPYRSIGRYLLDRGHLAREEISMQRIRQYLAEHPEIIDKVLNHNPSYIFFRVLENGPYGNINVPLTPERSLALDSRIFPKGALCFISGKKPKVDENNEIQSWKDFSRFFINQDTGGAIKGAGRADIFWGSGKYAEIAAGHMKHDGDLYVLIKKPSR